MMHQGMDLFLHFGAGDITCRCRRQSFCRASRIAMQGGVGLVLSHPWRGEAAPRMGHPAESDVKPGVSPPFCRKFERCVCGVIARVRGLSI